jgi:hypothetical protein
MQGGEKTLQELAFSALFAILFSLATLLFGGAEPTTVEVLYPHHVVREGESLWVIAVRYYPETDMHETVMRLRYLNGLETTLVRPGQVLRLEE